jgi:anti-sigma regulatory factor (Ser/Thr protein kinase)
MATVELSFTPLPAHVRTARLVATTVARRTGVEESLLDEVRLAVGEACSRAVEAHRLHCPGVPVRIQLSEQGGRFEVVVADAGPATGGAERGGDDRAGEDGARPGLAPGAAADGADPAAAVTGAASAGLDANEGFPAGLGLAVIAGLADDVEISTTANGVSIRMSWPAPGRSHLS